MAITFLEPGGDATFNAAATTAGGLWSSVPVAPTVVTDFVHGNHVKSLRFAPSTAQRVQSNTILLSAGSRFSFYLYIQTMPTLTMSIINNIAAGYLTFFGLSVTSGGVLRVVQAGSTTQVGSDGPTLSTGQWYRISAAFNGSSTTVNRIEVFVDGVSAISITNQAFSAWSNNRALEIGQYTAAESTFDYRVSDIYVDNSTDLTDPGDIWVTAKRPVSNGSLNEFTTQIGSGGSGYGAGHTPQVNERPTDTANGWRIANGGVNKTEEYNIESMSAGDIDITGTTLVGYSGWLRTARGNPGLTGGLILNGNSTAGGFTDVEVTRFVYVTSSTYLAGTGADIGVSTGTTSDTYSIYDCGVVVAYIPVTLLSPSVQNPIKQGVKII